MSWRTDDGRHEERPHEERPRGEPRGALAEVAELATAQADVGRRLAAAVGRARAIGASWAEIGAAAGITRQSAHERWRDVPVPTGAASPASADGGRP